MAEPAIDVVYVTTDAEDEYDRQALDTALAEGGDSMPFRDFLVSLGVDPDDPDDA